MESAHGAGTLRGAGNAGGAAGGSGPVQGWFFKLRQSHDNGLLTRHITRAWSKRYFVIVRDKVKWYRSADPYSGEAPCGFVNFQQILRIRVLNSETRLEDKFNRDEYGTFSIEIDSRQRRLVIRTPSREEAKLWTRELRRRMEIWTERTGVETLKEIAKPRRSVDTRDHIMQRIDATLDQYDCQDTARGEAKTMDDEELAGKDDEDVDDDEPVEEGTVAKRRSDRPGRAASSDENESRAERRRRSMTGSSSGKRSSASSRSERRSKDKQSSSSSSSSSSSQSAAPSSSRSRDKKPKEKERSGKSATSATEDRTSASTSTSNKLKKTRSKARVKSQDGPCQEAPRKSKRKTKKTSDDIANDGSVDDLVAEPIIDEDTMPPARRTRSKKSQSSKRRPSASSAMAPCEDERTTIHADSNNGVTNQAELESKMCPESPSMSRETEAKLNALGALDLTDEEDDELLRESLGMSSSEPARKTSQRASKRSSVQARSRPATSSKSHAKIKMVSPGSPPAQRRSSIPRDPVAPDANWLEEDWD